MLTFFAEPALKAAVRHRVAEHKRLDQIVQRTYWSDGKGCFIGCSLHSNQHKDFERLLGLPTWLAYLGESIFERLARINAVEFPLALYDAIPVGADLEPAREAFLQWSLERWFERAAPVAALLRRSWAGDEPNAEEWAKARSAASDAFAALDSFAAFAACATRAVRAARAARDAFAVLAASDARAAVAIESAAKLIELVRACAPVVVAPAALPQDPYFEAYRVQVMAEALKETPCPH